MSGIRLLQLAALNAYILIIVVALPVWAFITWSEFPDGLSFESTFSNRQVHAGDGIEMHGTVSVPPGCRVFVTRRAIDASGTIIHSSTARFAYRPDVESNVTLSDILIPPTAAVGRAHVARVMEWRCNWLQELFPPSDDLESLSFFILPMQDEDQ